MTITCSANASFDVSNLKVVGQAVGANGPFVNIGTKRIIFASQGLPAASLPTNVLTQVGLPAATATPGPLSLSSQEAPVQVVHGFGGSTLLKVARGKDAEGALTVSPLVSAPNQPLPAIGVPLALPTGLSVPNASIGAKAVEAPLTINAAPETPLGLSTIALTAKGKVGGREQTFGIPLVRVEVVRPVSVELPSNVEIKAGTTFELKGKVVRKGPFAEAVTLKLEGLPAGLKAEPASISVAPGKSDFSWKIVADPKAAPSTGSAKLSPAFQINKKDYATPPSSLAIKILASR